MGMLLYTTSCGSRPQGEGPGDLTIRCHSSRGLEQPESTHSSDLVSCGSQGEAVVKGLDNRARQPRPEFSLPLPSVASATNY